MHHRHEQLHRHASSVTRCIVAYLCFVAPITLVIFVNEVHAAPIQFKVPLWYQQKQLGEISIRVQPKPLYSTTQTEDRLWFEQKALTSLLNGLIIPTLLAQLNNSSRPTYLTDSDVRALGIQLNFDPRQLQLILQLKPAIQAQRDIDLLYTRAADDPHSIRPSTFSSYLNMAASSAYLNSQRSSSKTHNGWNNVRVNFNWLVNYRGWIAENNVQYINHLNSETNAELRSWSRLSSRIIKDDEAHAIRYTLGDLRLPFRGFQSFRGLGGFSATKNYTIKPYLITRPSGSQQFMLEQPSRVELLVNDRIKKVLHLDPGSYDLDNISRTQGLNDITVRIIDPSGREQILNQAFYVDNDLLKAGFSRFSYAIAMPSEFRDQQLHYDSSKTTFIGFHQYGFSDQFTAGVNLQIDEDASLAGIESLWGTPSGAISWQLASSNSDHLERDYASRLEYSYNTANLNYNMNFAMMATFTGKQFSVTSPLTPLLNETGSLNTLNDIANTYRVQMGRSINDDCYISLGAGYQKRRYTDNSWESNLTLRKQINTINLQISLRHRRSTLGKTDNSVQLSLNWFFDNNHQFFNTSYDSYDQMAQANWQYTPDTIIGQPRANVSVQKIKQQYQGSASVNYDSYRYRSAVIHDHYYDDSNVLSGTIENSRTSVYASTALVYVDGQMGFSQPISDSFVLFAPHASLADYNIDFDRSNSYSTTQINRFGPGILYNVQSYQPRKTSLNPQQLPVGIELGPDSFSFLPSYRSGTLVTVGSGATVYLSGTLLQPDGTPIVLQAGKLISSEPNAQALLIFTNRKGSFNTQGIKAGRYQLTLNQYPQLSTIIDIPNHTRGAFSLGDITLQATRQELAP
jgi:outer membrane usher protein